MEWYSEGVANAITTCRQQNALFIVYIKGNVLHCVSILHNRVAACDITL